MTRSVSCAAAGLAAVALAACNPFAMAGGREEGERAVTAFHEQLNGGPAESMALLASPDLSSAEHARLLRILPAVRRKLGKVTGSKNAGWNVRSTSLGTTVQLGQQTTFEQGTGFETFAFVVRNGKANLSGYNISSDDLIAR